MSLRRTLDSMALTVGRARSVPLSASCYVNRADMLALIERARAELPQELDEATALLVAHQEVLDNAEREGEQFLEDARARAAAMVEDTVVVATAQARAEAIMQAARSEATRLLRSADEYCDRRLGLFEADLEKTLKQVVNGRSRLQERSELDTFAEETGLAAAADSVDDADQARRAVERSEKPGETPSGMPGGTPSGTPSGDEHYDQEADPDYVRPQPGTPPVTVPAVPATVLYDGAQDGYDLTDRARTEGQNGHRVIDLTEAETAGLGPSRSLQ